VSPLVYVIIILLAVIVGLEFVIVYLMDTLASPDFIRRKRMKKTLLFLVMLLALAASFAMAATQDAPTPPIVIDPAIIVGILGAGIMGIPVSGLTEMLKRLIYPPKPGQQTPKGAGYACSAIVSIVATGVYLLLGHIFTILALVVYSAFVFLSANGIYKYAAK